mgnify:CR=1 FL=1
MLRFIKKFGLVLVVLIIQPVSFLHAHPHYVIIANWPFNDNLARKYKKHATIVALDGAVNHLVERGWAPDFILGDFDSITQTAKKHFQNLKVPFIPTPDQSMTDIEKGVQFCAERGAKTITLVCALGGNRNDHSFANLSLLRRHHGKGYKVNIETENEVIEFLKDEVAIRKAAIGGKFGLFGFPKAIATVDALEWPLNNFVLEMGWQESACNIIKKPLVTIYISGEALMILPR